jgi:hypothetical protein
MELSVQEKIVLQEISLSDGYTLDDLADVTCMEKHHLWMIEQQLVEKGLVEIAREGDRLLVREKLRIFAISGIHDLKRLFTFTAFSALILSPFVQGLFGGLGDGFGRITVGSWVGLTAAQALGTRYRGLSK